MALLLGGFPWGAMAVNILGCSFIGWFTVITGSGGRWGAPFSVLAFVMTGICGGYTTFSTFNHGLRSTSWDRWFSACWECGSAMRSRPGKRADHTI